MKNILVTGASGFIGKMLCNRLLLDGLRVRPAVRCYRHGDVLSTGCVPVVVGDLGTGTVWDNALEETDTVVHLAARVHVMNDLASDSLAEFRKVNVGGTLKLALQAANAGVNRFIYLSSIKVNGEETLLGRPFTEEDQPTPQDDYAVSKWEAEQALRELADKTGLEVVIIRPPLVYGPGVKANFETMMQWLNRDVPLPFGAIRNKRSLVALDNLVDMIAICLDHPTAANQTFLVADGEDLSTTELLKRTAAALGKPAHLLSLPQNILKTGLKLVGRDDVACRLCSSLQVDISKARALLDWTPPVTVDESLAKTARYFLALQ